MASFILGFLLIGIGGLLLLGDVREMWETYRAREWPCTRGVIKSCIAEPDDEEEAQLTYGLSVEYEYEVDGVSYSSHTHHAWTDPAYTNAAAAVYRDGKEVTVYYKPTDPEASLLEAQLWRFRGTAPLPTLPLGLVGFSLAMVVIGIALIVRALSI